MSSDPSTRPGRGVLRGGALPARYGALLKDALPPELLPLAPFFADLSRLDTLAALLDRHLDTGPRGPARHILNIGCGPMATELFCGALQHRQIVSLDYTPAFVAFGHRLQREGLLPGVEILQGDAMAVDWPDARFDAIILHDILYERALDIRLLLPRLSRFLAPGGLVILDVMDARLHGLWRLMGRERGYRRYGLDEVDRAISLAGLTAVERRPVQPGAGLARQAMHRALRLGGLSNAVAFVARRTGAGRTGAGRTGAERD